jgi:1,4-alpha-glucan branching enzyme
VEERSEQQRVSMEDIAQEVLSTPITVKDNGGFKKEYLKSRPVCRVTFRLPKEAAPEAQKVTIVGEFSNWDKKSYPMKRLKDGGFTITIELENGREYCFRYLVDGRKWINDWYADKYLKNPFGGEDSVVIV